MAWARVDDGWWCHPKAMALDLTASGLWVKALSWSCAQRSPVIPRQFPSMVGSNDEATAKQIVASGLWHEGDHDCPDCGDPGDGWIVHNWAEYQQKTTSEKRAEAGRKGGKASGEARRAAKQTEATDEATDEANPKQGAKQVPDPARPEPEVQDPSAGAATTVDVDGFEDPMPVRGPNVIDELDMWARSQGFDCDSRKPSTWSRWMLEIVDQTLGDGKYSHGLRVEIIGWLVETVTGDPPASELYGHLRRLVSLMGGLETHGAMVEALGRGVGTDGVYRDDPRSLTKYARAVIAGKDAA